MLRDGSVCTLGKDSGTTSQDGCATECSVAGKKPVGGAITGVIRITDVCLSWLHPSRAYTCISIAHDHCLQNINLWLAANNCAMVGANVYTLC